MTGLREILLAVAALGLALGVQSHERLDAAPEVRTTPYPYNTDASGDDLPVEIGRFEVASDRAAATRKIELGFVRYFAATDTQRPPVVFLIAGETPSTERLNLYYALRETRDVVIFNHRGYGFSSALEPCAQRLIYPSDSSAAAAALTNATSEHYRTCIANLQTTEIDAGDYLSHHVSHDLADLADALGAASIDVVAEGKMAPIAEMAARHHRGLVRNLVLVDPGSGLIRTEGFLLRTLLETPSTRGQQSVSAAMRLVLLDLSVDRPAVTINTSSGREIEILPGPQDLAFLLVQAVSGSDAELAVLAAALEDALEEDYTALGELVLDTRQRIAEVDPVTLINASVGPAVYSSTEISYALAWPVIEGPRFVTAPESGESSQNAAMESKVLVIGRSPHARCAAQALRRIADRYENGAVAAPPCGPLSDRSETELFSSAVLDFLGT